jgi:hypothetical protein
MTDEKPRPRFKGERVRLVVGEGYQDDELARRQHGTVTDYDPTGNPIVRWDGLRKSEAYFYTSLLSELPAARKGGTARK